MVLVYLLDYRPSHLLYSVSLASEVSHCLLECLLAQLVAVAVNELMLIEWALHCQHLQALLLASLVVVAVDDSYHTVPYHVGDIHSDTLTHECVATLLIYYGTLLVHHVVVFEQTLTYTEVVFLHLLLCALDASADHWCLDTFALLESESVHHAGDALRSEQSHELVFQRDIENGATRVALTTGTTTQLTVYATTLVALGTDDGETTGSLHLVGELDVSTTTSHVGSDGHGTQSVHAATCLCHDVCLLLVELGIQYVVRNLAHGEHLREHFGNLHGCRTHEARTSLVAHLLDFFNHSLIFLACSLVHAVIHIVTYHWLVGRNLHNVEFVDVPELTSLGRCRTRHTSQFVVHTEVVLQGDGCVCLCGSLHLHVFLSLHGLMQSVAPAASLHDTACLLVNDLNLAVDDNILIILVEHTVSLEQLLQGMYALALHAIVVEQLVLLVDALLIGETCLCLQSRQLGGDVG